MGAPGDDRSLSAIEWRRGAQVLAGWVLGWSLSLGVVEGMRAGYALRVFGAEPWIAWVVALGALRLRGAGVAASAVAVAIVTTCHRRAAALTPLPRTRSLWPVFAALPLVTPIAACLLTASGVATASLVFDIPVSTSWEGIRAHLIPADLLAGMGIACLLALVLAVAARATLRVLTRMRGGLLAKILVVLVTTRGMTTLVNAALEAGSPSGVDPIFQGASDRLQIPRD
jgi:hypothetical protein